MHSYFALSSSHKHCFSDPKCYPNLYRVPPKNGVFQVSNIHFFLAHNGVQKNLHWYFYRMRCSSRLTLNGYATPSPLRSICGAAKKSKICHNIPNFFQSFNWDKAGGMMQYYHHKRLFGGCPSSEYIAIPLY